MKQDESQNVEYKRSWHDEYLKWVCGFANAKGGTIWIGIDDDKSVHGVEKSKKLMEDIPNKIKDTMGLVVTVSLLKKQKKDVLRIDIPESEFPVAYHGEYHLRTGSTKQQLTGFALTQFLFHKMHLSWDAVETVNRLKARAYTFKRLKIRFENRAHRTIKGTDLVSFGLVTREGVLTNAGALLTDDCPIPQSRLFCTRWAGIDKAADAADSRKEQSNILELLDLAESFIRTHTRVGWVKRPRERDNYPEYPDRAVTEALVNAFIHRDYTICGSEVHVDVFDDHIDITSPGGMPDGSLVQDLDWMNVPSDRRNGILADVFDRLEYMERAGSGFKKIVDAYADLGKANPERLRPKLYSAVNCFVVTLPRIVNAAAELTEARVATSVTQGTKGAQEVPRKYPESTQKTIDAIRENPFVTRMELAQIVGITSDGVKKILNRLKSSHIIRRVGPDNGGHWEVD